MGRVFRITTGIASILLIGAALAVAPESVAQENVAASSTAAVADVYVSNGSKVYAFSAAANGKLTKVPGSPFSAALGWIGTNSKYLFGFKSGGSVLASYSMASNGALKQMATINTADFDPSSCTTATEQFRIDHSGQNLYNAVVPDDLFCGTPFQSYKIDNSNGKLSFLGETNTILFGEPEVDFLGNNKYAYSPECLFIDGNQYAAMQVYKRPSSGELELGNQDNPFPPDPSGQGFYCPVTLATDPTDHIAVMLLDVASEDDAAIAGECCNEAPVIATVTAAANGGLSTKSTYKNMPSAVTAGPLSETNAMRMSPSGKFLAVGGPGGLEVFHFNGANPITKYKLVISNQAIAPIAWDKNNHLYAIGSTGKLYVYTVTATSITEAPGSPYAIPNAGFMAVHTE